MAIIKKDQVQEGQNLPISFVELSEKLAGFKVKADYFKNCYEQARGEAQEYLESKSCPLVVKVGPGGGVKVPGVVGYSFSQPERLEQEEALKVVIAGLKSGKIRPDDLGEIISTFDKDAVVKVFGAEGKACVHSSEKVIVTPRVNGEFRAAGVAELEKSSQPEPEVVQIPVVQPKQARRSKKASEQPVVVA